ncbi:hypothetical protein [Amycolatopsis thermoflava]|uniref:hypothetical protein n=1 Tax=Amycolatopsis thermoflava TaxID=84480 RepID=UPI0011CD844D|nr:hypothetical protein [Amycolatopsis thermoflava]
MLSKSAQAILFTSSFSPILIVFALLDSWGRGLPSIICAAIAIVSIAALPLVLRGTRQLNAVPMVVKVARRKDVETLSYIATFLVPFITVAADSPKKRVALGIFVALIALFYIRGEMYFWNPILGLRGYRAIEVELGSEEIVTLITKRKFIRAESEVRAIPLSHQIYWELN